MLRKINTYVTQVTTYNYQSSIVNSLKRNNRKQPNNLIEFYIMITYIFKVIPSSSVRGYNREVIVYRIKNNKPLFVGYNDRINTAAYKGDRAIANQIICDVDSHKMADGYSLLSKNIQLFEI